MLHRLKHPGWLIAEVLPLYPSFANRSKENAPFHINGYGCNGAPLTWTGGLRLGFAALNKEDALLMFEPEMIGDQSYFWNEDVRLWETKLKPGWTLELEDIANTMWRDGRTCTAQELGVSAATLVAQAA